MKIITLILVAITAAVLGYTFAQYRGGVARMHVIKARHGTLEEDAVKTNSGRLVLSGVDEKSVYVSAEQPRDGLKAENLTSILHRPEDGEAEARSLRGKLYYSTATHQKSRWILIRNVSYDTSKKEASFVFEELSLRRDPIQKEAAQSEEALSNIELVILS
jgi:hypothetical protein